MNNPGTQLMTISDMTTVEAVLMVDETDIPSVEVGQTAEADASTPIGDRQFDGVVTEVGLAIARNDVGLRPDTTSDAINFKVRVQLKDPPPTIRPGFSVTADIITGTGAPASLAVPIRALVVREKDATGGPSRPRRGRLHPGSTAREDRGLRRGHDRPYRRAPDRGPERPRAEGARWSPARSRRCGRSRTATGSTR